MNGSLELHLQITSMRHRVVFLLLLACSWIVPSQSHVALLYPPARTDDDYLFTFDGSCEIDSCDSFCGDPYDLETANVTELAVGVPITLRWFSPVPHDPLMYRLSLNREGKDKGFDDPDHILATVSASEASEGGGNSRVFSTDVIIPADALEDCSGPDPCVLQLFDLYYFVSCANVLLVPFDNNPSDPGLPSVPETPTIHFNITDWTDTILVEAASFSDYRITAFGNPPALDPTIQLQRYKTYTFYINAPGHPFVLTTSPGGELIPNELAPGNVGIETGKLELQLPPSGGPSTIYYQCTLHPEMIGTINVTASSPFDRKTRPSTGKYAKAKLSGASGGAAGRRGDNRRQLLKGSKPSAVTALPEV